MLKSKISEWILFLMGWKAEVSKELIEKLNSEDKIILIFPHSSYFDFFIMLLYSFIYQEYLPHEVCTLMQPGVFKYFGSILSRLGCIPAGSIHEKGKTFDKIKDTLNMKNKFLFLISPKGR